MTTLFVSVVGNYFATAYAIQSCPLSGSNTLMTLCFGTVSGLVVTTLPLILFLKDRLKVSLAVAIGTVVGFVANVIGMIIWLPSVTT